MSAIISNTVSDAQTAITSLGAAIAGSASEAIGNRLIMSANAGAGNGIGDVGIRFVVRALVSSVAFGVAANLMPESSSNIFFSIVYFAANPSLVRDGVAIGNIVVGTAARGFPIGPIVRPPPQRQSEDCRGDCK